LERPQPGWTAFVFTLPAPQNPANASEKRRLAIDPEYAPKES
jgi:hypothetical protein